MEHEYNTVEEALEDLKQGKIVLVTDDENRENEGDMICAAEFATHTCILTVAVWIMTARPTMFTMFTSEQ